MDFETAIRTAEQWLAQCEADRRLKLRLFRGEMIERDFGWVFFWGPEDESAPVAGELTEEVSAPPVRSTLPR